MGEYICSLCGFASEDGGKVFLHLEEHGITLTSISEVDAHGMLMRYHLQDGTMIYYDISGDLAGLKDELKKRLDQLEAGDNQAEEGMTDG